jgi:adenosylmethionine-8-amino-7-oxononanoate aminotransferase
MSRVLYRRTDESPDEIIKGRDYQMLTGKDRVLLDMSSGPCTSILGHSNAVVIDAIKKQLDRIPYVFGGFWKTEASEAAGDRLASLFANEGALWFSHVLFQSTGGEAVDLACKIAVQYHAEGGDHRNRFVTREHSFHGVGLLPFSLSGRYPRYDALSSYQAPTTNSYVIRAKHPKTSSGEESLRSIKEALAVGGVAAVVVEPIGGPPTGAWVDAYGYYKQLRQMCTHSGALLIFDEVLCGAYRCGYVSVSSYYGVEPDIVILGKGLSAGYVPMSAICLSNDVYDRIASGSKALAFGTTYSAHTLGCAAIDAAMGEIANYVPRIRSDHLMAQANHYLASSPSVKNLRGLGYLIGVELCDNRGKTFAPELQMHARARKMIYDLGVVVYSKGQTVYGAGDFLIIAPPVIISDAVIEAGLAKIYTGISEATKGFG